MVTLRNYRRPTLITGIFAAMAAAAVSTAAPALAANTIEVSGIGPSNLAVDYSCDSTARVAGIMAMVGDPNADSPSATGTVSGVTCDGTPQTAVIPLAALDGTDASLSSGQTVQVRVALVDSDRTVVSGQAKLVSLA